jgi:hypothetical protein
MKKILLTLLVLAFSAPIFAQTNSDDIAIIQSLYGKEKKELVKAYMVLSDADAAKFWPIYEAYEIERKTIGKRRLENISNYVNTYGHASEQEIDKMTLNSIKNNTAYDKLLGKYYGKLKKSLGSKTAAKFFQLENYLMIGVNASIYDNIPFIDELEDNKKD